MIATLTALDRRKPFKRSPNEINGPDSRVRRPVEWQPGTLHHESDVFVGSNGLPPNFLGETDSVDVGCPAKPPRPSHKHAVR
jgi:hypothetical protein